MESTGEVKASSPKSVEEPQDKAGELKEQSVQIEQTEKAEREAELPEDGEVEESKVTNSEPSAPPLPSEAPPTETEDDGWDAVWDQALQAFYFYNRFTGATQWTNPRVPEATPSTAPGVPAADPSNLSTNPPPPPPSETPVAGGYNPAIHGDYDPNAWYAQTAVDLPTDSSNIASSSTPTDPAAQYAASAGFNRFTGRFQNPDLNPENFNDENKSKRQMNAFFDVDAAANSHDGRSLKAERSGKKLSKTELKQFKEKRKAKKEEKRRAWLRD